MTMFPRQTFACHYSKRNKQLFPRQTWGRHLLPNCRRNVPAPSPVTRGLLVARVVVQLVSGENTSLKAINTAKCDVVHNPVCRAAAVQSAASPQPVASTKKDTGEFASVLELPLFICSLFAVVVETFASFSSQLVCSNHFSQQWVWSVFSITKFCVQSFHDS